MTTRAPDDVPAEVRLDAGRVRALLAAQHPDLAGLSVSFMAEGWDNALFRVGSALIARMPRRALGATNIETELRWLPALAPRLPLPVPAAIRRGEPGEGYPWRWALVPWLDGEPAGIRPSGAAALQPHRAAAGLGAFLRALHDLPVPADAPSSPFRGVPLASRGEAFAQRIASLGDSIDGTALLALWGRLAAAPGWGEAPTWCHGDMHPFNLLIQDGGLSAVLDWGDLHGGEPAPDLASPWMLLHPRDHGPFLAAYGEIDAATWARARGWALYFAVTFIDAGRKGAGASFEAAGWRMLEHVAGV